MDLLSANSHATLSAPQLSPSGKCSTLSPSWLSGRSLNSISRAANFDGIGQRPAGDARHAGHTGVGAGSGYAHSTVALGPAARGTPFSLIHLRNMMAATGAGAAIMPAFYSEGLSLPALFCALRLSRVRPASFGDAWHTSRAKRLHGEAVNFVDFLVIARIKTCHSPDKNPCPCPARCARRGSCAPAGRRLRDPRTDPRFPPA